MQRTLLKDLQAWKQAPGRKPLVLMGARQVGKTYLLNEFAASEYENFVHINFESNKSLHALFAGDLRPKEILQALVLESKQQIEPGRTLIIFDEIQECPNAINSLKYFNEEANEYHVCAAGSLLGVKLKLSKGFPVGKVQFLYLFPLDFFEFLQAIDENHLLDFIKNITVDQSIAAPIHEKLLKLFKYYMFIGGMPEAVNGYVNNKLLDPIQIREIQNTILTAYKLDFAKHAPADQLMRINQVWNIIPSQLAKENKKFIYSLIRHGARAKDFEIAIQWLTEAELICKVYNVSTPKVPLKAYCDFNFFKLYLLDVGLLGSIADLDADTLLNGNQLFQEFKGSLTENYVAQELHKQNCGVTASHELYYWTKEGAKSELDFIIQHSGDIYPLEVKSGLSHTQKSLNVYREHYSPKLAVRLSPQSIELTKDFLNLPLYLLPRIRELLSSAVAD